MALFNTNRASNIEQPRKRGRPPKVVQPEASSALRSKLALPLWNRQRLPIILFIIIALAVAFYFYNQNQSALRRLNELQSSSEKTPESTTKVVEQVGKHVLLPEGETPTLATVEDVSKLSSQTFFAHAAQGDKVLVYNKARKVILYRPSADRVVEMAPLTTDSAQPAQ